MTQSAVAFKTSLNGREHKTDGLWSHLGNLLLNTLTVTGKATLPAGTAQALLGSYTQGSNWQVPSINVWYESVAQVTVTCTTGAIQRFEASGTLNFSGGQTVYVSPGMDGAVTQSTWAFAFQTNTVVTYTTLVYFTGVAAGPHRFSVHLHSTAGTGGFWPNAVQTLYVTEQRA